MIDGRPLARERFSGAGADGVVGQLGCLFGYGNWILSSPVRDDGGEGFLHRQLVERSRWRGGVVRGHGGDAVMRECG